MIPIRSKGVEDPDDDKRCFSAATKPKPRKYKKTKKAALQTPSEDSTLKKPRKSKATMGALLVSINSLLPTGARRPNDHVLSSKYERNYVVNSSKFFVFFVIILIYWLIIAVQFIKLLEQQRKEMLRMLGERQNP